jgi:hypothetical protein
MKKYIAVVLLSIVTITVAIAQNVPQGIAYQAVAIKDGPHSLGGQNASSFNWSNKDIQVRFTIFEKYPGGSNQYSEVHKTTTDEYGVFNLIIGQGKVINGIFDNIPWELGTAHLQVEIDFENNNFKVTSFERFWSVPYAFVTRKSKGINTDSALNALNGKFNYLKNRDKDTVIGNEGGVSYKSLDSLNKALKAQLVKMKLADKDTVIGNEWQNLSLKKDSLLISNGKGIKLLDNDSLNEIQKLTRLKDTVSLSKNGGKFVLNDDDPKNELQDLVLSNDTLFLTKSNSFIILSKNSSTNSTTADTISSMTDLNNLLLNRKVWPKVGITQLNGPWTSDAIFGKQKNWTNWGRFNYNSRIDMSFESGDSVIFLSNSNDTLFSYSFNMVSKKFSGPVSIYNLYGYNPSNDIELLAKVDKKNKCFYWFGDKGLCIYSPLTNQFTATPSASSNFNFLSKWNPKCTISPCTGFKVFLNKKINDTIYFFVEDKTDTKCQVYKYDINQDNLTQLYTSKFSMDSISNMMVASGGFTKFFHSPNEAIFSASDYGFITDSLVIFSKMETYFNGKFFNGAFIYNYRINTVRFIDTRFNGEVICEHPKIKGLFIMGKKNYKNKSTQNGYNVGSMCDEIYGLWNFKNNTVLDIKNVNIDDIPSFSQMQGGLSNYDVSYINFKSDLYQIQHLRNTINTKSSDQLFFYKFPY